jgi:hypothetical protein
MMASTLIHKEIFILSKKRAAQAQAISGGAKSG